MNAVTAINANALPSNPSELIFNDHAFERMERVAQIMASGKATIPAHLRGSPGDCFAILLQSARWGMDPYAVSQKTHLVNGTLGYEAQLVIAVVNANAPIVGRLKFEWFGPWEKVSNGKTDKSDAGVRVFATLRGDDEPSELKITMAQSGVRNSPLWADDPRQQLAYLAAKRWARLYCPDVILGVYTPDELETPIERDMGPAQVVTEQPSETIKDKLRKKMTRHVALPSIIDRINAAETLDALDAVKSDATLLPEDDRTVARRRFAERRAELIRTPVEATVDTETGEITEQVTDDLSQSAEYADWISAIDACATVSDIARLVKDMPGETKAALNGELHRRQDEIKRGTN